MNSHSSVPISNKDAQPFSHGKLFQSTSQTVTSGAKYVYLDFVCNLKASTFFIYINIPVLRSCNWVRVCGYLKVPGCTERLDVTTGSQITGHLQTHGFNIRGYQANPDFIGWGTVNFPSGITYDPSARHRILDAAVFLPEEEEENVIFCTNCFAYNESEHDRFIAITSVILKPPSRFPEGFSHQYVAEYRLAQCRINSQHSVSFQKMSRKRFGITPELIRVMIWIFPLFTIYIPIMYN